LGVFRWHRSTFAKPDITASQLSAARRFSVTSADRARRENSDRLSSWIYRIECEDGGCYLIYNASVLSNPPDHVPDKWYFQPFPVLPGFRVGAAFDTAGDAERAAREVHRGIVSD
jgi:hypothetical protein